MRVYFKWNGYIDRWVCRDRNGNYIEEFVDCTWFNKMFNKLDKDQVNIYDVDGIFIRYE